MALTGARRSPHYELNITATSVLVSSQTVLVKTVRFEARR